VWASCGPAGRLGSAVRGWLGRYGRARPRCASRCGLSRCRLPVLPPAAHAVRTRTGAGLRTVPRGRPACPGRGAAHRPVRAGAWRGPRATRCLAAARSLTAGGSRPAVALRSMGGPVRRAAAAPCGLIRAPPRGLIRAAIGATPRGLIRARNRRRTVPWCLFSGRLRRNRAVSQLGARVAARGQAVLQIRIAHPASVFLLGAPHGAVRHFSWLRRLVTRPRDGCPHLGCSPGYPHESRDDASGSRLRAGAWRPASGPADRPPGGGHPTRPRRPRGAYRMLHFAVPGAGRYPYLTSMSIGMPVVPRPA